MSLEQAGLGAKARNAAMRVFVARYPDVWAQIHGDEREKLGLPRTLTGHHNKRWGKAKGCNICGGPKDRQVRGARNCSKCAAEKEARDRARWEQRNATAPMKPCRRCGGEKRRGIPSQLCDNCRPLAAQERREKAAKRKREAPKVPRAEGRQRAVQKAERSAPKKRVRVTKARPSVPREVKAAWNAGDPNSIIRRKYPTLKALEKAYC